MRRPERYYGYLRASGLTNHECLLVPLDVDQGSAPFGTLWLVSHDEAHEFDRQDERIARDLTRFVGLTLRMVARSDEVKLQLTRMATQVHALEQERDSARSHSQRLDLIGARTAGIAHDFRNLLQVVDSYSEMIERSDSPERIKKVGQEFREQISRGRDMTDRLLTTSRASVGIARATIQQALEESESAIHQLLGLHIRFTFKSAPGLWTCAVDARRLESALLNLAANSKYAMPEGGEFHIEADNLLVATRAHSTDLEPGEYVTVTVTDTGSGMPEETLARVRQAAFYTSKPEGEGTGLGFAQVREFVDCEGGAWFISSTPGIGTTVLLCFPVPKEAGADHPH